MRTLFIYLVISLSGCMSFAQENHQFTELIYQDEEGEYQTYSADINLEITADSVRIDYAHADTRFELEILQRDFHIERNYNNLDLFDKVEPVRRSYILRADLFIIAILMFTDDYVVFKTMASEGVTVIWRH
ncbi:MAG: hypothetical protein LAT68_00520 [Cyclobacteriaceae bacterium]|nr:hypothetical protein [Cyclobacteriaceae bacterium]MCH8514786.1 hypothetical protein [Cyclobacteriaceae bacterium]